MNNRVIIEIDGSLNRLKISFPLTAPTSKVRVKRIVDNQLGVIQGEPVGKLVDRKKYNELEDCYLEWQISYYSSSEQEVEGILELNKDFLRSKGLRDIKNFKFNNSKGDTVFLYELSLILLFGVFCNIFSREELEEIYKFARSIEGKDIFLQNKKIYRSNVKDFSVEGVGFSLVYENYPLFLYANYKDSNKLNFFIEVILKHKQRAIGYQSMVFLCIPLQECFADLELAQNTPVTMINKKIKSKSRVYMHLDYTNKFLVKKTLEAFVLASRDHNKDIQTILEYILKLSF